MAQIAWTSTQVPGAVTGAPADTTARPTVSGRCARCERWNWEQKCPGVYGDTHPSS